MMKHGFRILSVLGKTDTHCVCALDYDNVEFKVLKSNAKEVMNNCNLGSFYVFKTSKNHFAALCFSLVSEKELEEILQVSLADLKQVEAFDKMKVIGFRISSKNKRKLPMPFAVIKRKSNRKQSDSHIVFFKGLYPGFIKEKNDNNFSDLVIEEFKLKEATK